ncbi:hypothetical protein FOL47_007069 [Perkinsus chesapeaki]|uniref:Peptidase C1A papain C-terminal domain-containing protein n=1 Tax=Perkinsus chesapeaki TaxID=330153 RepID=A0A7J6LN92_PERCH|nr:hypothetical protein FOL47_007069 [Perkinsus chesapeaki]
MPNYFCLTYLVVVAGHTTFEDVFAGLKILSGTERNAETSACLSCGDVMDLHGGFMEAKPYSAALPVANRTLAPVGDLPLDFDGRKEFKECTSLIGSVPDQSNCGSCAAVSVAAAFSDRLCIKTKGKVKRLLSSGYLIACCDPDTGCTRGSGCLGGQTSEMWTFVQEYGFPTGGGYTPKESMSEASGCWPYNFPKCNHNVGLEPHRLMDYPPCPKTPAEPPACSSTCPNDKYKNELDDDLHFIDDKGAVRIPDVETMKLELSQFGSVTANMEVYEDFRYYKSGVYTPTQGKPIGPHSVKLIGWGKRGKDEYWLAVNSWNEGWGESGLFRIATGKCKIEEDVVYGDPEVDT